MASSIDESFIQVPGVEKLCHLTIVALAELLATRLLTYSALGKADEADETQDPILHAINVLMEWLTKITSLEDDKDE